MEDNSSIPKNHLEGDSLTEREQTNYSENFSFFNGEDSVRNSTNWIENVTDNDLSKDAHPLSKKNSIDRTKIAIDHDVSKDERYQHTTQNFITDTSKTDEISSIPSEELGQSAQSSSKRVKEEIDQVELEKKYRSLDRQEVPLQSQLYDSRCSAQTREILKQIDSYIGSHILVMNDCYFTKGIWEKIKVQQKEKEDKAYEMRRKKVAQLDRLLKVCLPSITPKKRFIRTPTREVNEKKPIVVAKRKPCKKLDIHGTVWRSTSSLKKDDDCVIEFANEDFSIHFPKSWSRVETMYKKAEKLVYSAVIDEKCSKPFWIRKTSNLQPASYEETEQVPLPKIEE